MLAPVGLTSKESLSHGIARYEHGTAGMPYHQRIISFHFGAFVVGAKNKNEVMGSLIKCCSASSTLRVPQKKKKRES